jgi:hypothetical protein
MWAIKRISSFGGTDGDVHKFPPNAVTDWHYRKKSVSSKSISSATRE